MSIDPAEGIADQEFVPLAHFLDAGGPDAIAATIEADSDGGVYPVFYLRRSGRTEERVLPGHPFHQFDSAEHQRAVASLLAEVGLAAAEGRAARVAAP